MSNLIPEHRTDVTGKVVLRHVLPPSHASAVLASIPAPSVETDTYGKDFAKVKWELATHLSGAERAAQGPSDDPHDYYQGNIDESGLDLDKVIQSFEVGTMLAELEPRTVSHISDKFGELGAFGGPDYPNMVLYYLSKYRGDSQTIDLMTYMYDARMKIYQGNDLYDGEIEPYPVLSDAARGLHEYAHLGYEPPEDIFTATEEERTLAIGLASLRFDVEDRYNKSESDGRGLGVKPAPDGHARVIVDEELVRMFLIDPERVQQLMAERDTADGTLIRSIMEASNPSLSDGIL